MQQIKKQLEALVPDLNSAIKNLNAEDQYATWVVPFTTKLVNICLPDYKVTLEKRINPQDEESKDPLTFKQKLEQSVNQFVALVEEIEEEATCEKAHLDKKMKKCAQEG